MSRTDKDRPYWVAGMQDKTPIEHWCTDTLTNWSIPSPVRYGNGYQKDKKDKKGNFKTERVKVYLPASYLSGRMHWNPFTREAIQKPETYVFGIGASGYNSHIRFHYVSLDVIPYETAVRRADKLKGKPNFKDLQVHVGYAEVKLRKVLPPEDYSCDFGKPHVPGRYGRNRCHHKYVFRGCPEGKSCTWCHGPEIERRRNQGVDTDWRAKLRPARVLAEDTQEWDSSNKYEPLEDVWYSDLGLPEKNLGIYENSDSVCYTVQSKGY